MIQQCPHCGERILEGESIETTAVGDVWHIECFTRAVLGSLAHLKQRCSCYIPGSTEHDPPGMTRREAARAAVDYLRFLNRANVLNVDGACPACASKAFHLGPRSGTARNIKCAQCGAKYWYAPPFPPERIDNDDRLYDDGVVVNLGAIRPRIPNAKNSHD